MSGEFWYIGLHLQIRDGIQNSSDLGTVRIYFTLWNFLPKLCIKNGGHSMRVSECIHRTKQSLSLGMHYVCGYKRTVAKKPELQIQNTEFSICLCM